MPSSGTTGGKAEILFWSKDSIHVRWRFPDYGSNRSVLSNGDVLHGYKIRYQAIGSSVVQYTRLLDPATDEYGITHLHENTNYDICVLRVTAAAAAAAAAATAAPSTVLPGPSTAALNGIAAAAAACIKGTTATDSLSVALGSTFGAFLALGFIVALVFVAKWQHSRRLAKQFEAVDAADADDDAGLDDGSREAGEAWKQNGCAVPHGADTDVITVFYGDDVTDSRGTPPGSSSPPFDPQQPSTSWTAVDIWPVPVDRRTSTADASVGSPSSPPAQLTSTSGLPPSSLSSSPSYDCLPQDVALTVAQPETDDDDDDDRWHHREQQQQRQSRDSYDDAAADVVGDAVNGDVIVVRSTSDRRGKQPASRCRQQWANKSKSTTAAAKNGRRSHDDDVISADDITTQCST